MRPEQQDLCDWRQEMSDIAFEDKVVEYIAGLSDSDVDACIDNVSTSNYYEDLIGGRYKMYRASIAHSAYAAKASDSTIPGRFDFCSTYQEYLGVAVEEEAENRKRLQGALETANQLVLLARSGMEDGAFDQPTLTKIKTRLVALQSYYPEAHEMIYGTRQSFFDPNAQDWWYVLFHSSQKSQVINLLTEKGTRLREF